VKNYCTVMFRAIIVVGVSACYQSAFSEVIIKPHKNGIVHEITIEGTRNNTIEVYDEEYTTVDLLGVDGKTGVVWDIGRPGVPVVRFYIHGDEPIAVVPGTQFTHLEKIEHLIYPNQMSMAKSEYGPRPFFMDKTSYASDEYLPKKSYDTEEAGSIRGVRRRMVTLYPYYYKPSTGEQKYRKKFLVYSGKQETEPVTNIQRSDETILFIVGKKFRNSLALLSYAQFKRSLGYLVYIEYVNDLSGELTTPQLIRKRIQTYYKNPDLTLRHVLLIGDIDDVSANFADNLSGSSLVTDHYYRAIDTDNYNTDINGPDIGVGRISAATRLQLKTILDKYTRYQKGRFENQDWLSKASFIASDDGFNYQIAEGTHNFVMKNYTGPAEYTGTFPQATTGGDKLYAISHSAKTSDLLRAFNDGRAIINYSGHGSTHDWVGPTFRPSEIDLISHEEALPFVVSNACITGQFTVTESFAESWQRSPKGGVFFWGSMDNSYWDEDDLLEKEMYKIAFKSNRPEFYKMTQGSLEEIWRHYGGGGRSSYYWETYHSFGDPSISLRSSPAQEAHVVLIDSDRREGLIHLQVIGTNGMGIGNARVTLTTPSGRRSSVISADSGYVSFGMDSNDIYRGSNLELTVSGPKVAISNYAISLN